MDLEQFNALPRHEAEQTMLSCCPVPRWAGEVVAGRPYTSVAALHDVARAALRDADLDEAMAGHPRIGDRGAGGQSQREQSAVGGADPDVLAALDAGNRAYEERFGHIYLVRAAGRSAEDLLAVLHARLDNDPATERSVALAELAAINLIRIDRLVTQDAG